MIIFSSDKLERALSRFELDEWQKAKYVLLFLCLYAFSGAFPSFIFLIRLPLSPAAPHSSVLASALCNILVMVLTYLGVRKCYLTNKAADDRDFVGRFFALYVPASLELLAVIVGFLIVVGLSLSFGGAYLPRTARHLPSMPRAVLIYVVYVAIPIATWLFFYILNRSFGRLAALVSKKHIATDDAAGGA